MIKIAHNLNFSNEDPTIKGFQELVLSVSNLNRYIDLFERVFGWEVLYRQMADENLNKLWKLDSSVEIEEALITNPNDTEGFLRLVQFKNVPQQQIRSASHIWDSGGIYDVNIRVADIDTFYAALQQEGWNGISNPVRYTFDGYDVSEVLVKGPDGIIFALIQRHSPPLIDFEHMGKTSRIFNSSIAVSNIVESREFYVDKLGFHVLHESDSLDPIEGYPIVGLPKKLKNIQVPLNIVRPDPNAYGSLECVTTNGISGEDYSHLAKLPNLGALMYRFPVRDANAYAAKLKEKGLLLNSEVHHSTIQPYGNLKIFSVLSPDGVWLEFIEV